MAEGIGGTFTGFAFNGTHSQSLGITRVSQSNRYDDQFLPSIKDNTVDIPGADGTYFFNSKYSTKQFTLNIAFDGVEEWQYRKIAQVYGDKKIHQLVFDDAPYKYYLAKTTGSAILKTICFDENRGDGVKRYFKGEGTLQLTAYYPFGKSTFKTLDEFETWKDSDEEWKRICYNNQDFELDADENKVYDWMQGNYISDNFETYNSGDMESPFTCKWEKETAAVVYYTPTEDVAYNKNKTYYTKDGVPCPTVDGTKFPSEYYDKHIGINTTDCGRRIYIDGDITSQLLLDEELVEIPLDDYESVVEGTQFIIKYEVDSGKHLISRTIYVKTAIEGLVLKVAEKAVNYRIKGGNFFKIPIGAFAFKESIIEGGTETEVSNTDFTYEVMYY